MNLFKKKKGIQILKRVYIIKIGVNYNII